MKTDEFEAPAYDVARTPFSETPQQRTVLFNCQDGRRYAVVHAVALCVWLMPCTPRSREWPRPVTLHALNERLGDQPMYRLHEPSGDAKSPPSWQLDAGSRRNAELKETLKDTARVTTPKGRAEIVGEIRTALHLSEPAAYELLRRWLAGGMIPAALVANQAAPVTQAIDVEAAKKLDLKVATQACRAAALAIMETPHVPPELVDHNLRSGSPRKRKQGSLTRFECDAFAVRVIWDAIQKNSQPGKRDKHRRKWLLQNVFCRVNQAGQKEELPAYAVPSIRQIGNWRQKLVPVDRAIRMERGPNWTDKNAQAMLFSQASETDSAGGKAQIDATVWNITLVADTPQREPIGPPVVFRARAKNGGMLMGIHVGLESASWAEAAGTIDSCMKDKVLLAAENDLHIEREDWPAVGVSAEYIADCGETFNSRPQSFIKLTGVHLTNLPADRPNLKGGVEGDFFVIQTDLNGMTPAAIIKRWEDDTKKKWVSKASLTIKQFTAILIAQELRNMKRPRQRTKLPVHDSNGVVVDTSPLGIWRYLAARNGTGLRDFSVMSEDVRISLLARENGSITEHGLLFRGLYYVAVERKRHGDYQAVRYASSRSRVTVGFDHRLVDTVYIVPEEGSARGEFIECVLNTEVFGQSGLLGKTFKEARTSLDQTKEANAEAIRTAEASDTALADFQRRIIETAEEQTAAARESFPSTVAEQIKNMPAARERERARHSPSTALVPHAEGSDSADPSNAAKSIAEEAPIQGKVVSLDAHRSNDNNAGARRTSGSPEATAPTTSVPPQPSAGKAAPPTAPIPPHVKRLLDRAITFGPPKNKE